MVQTSHDADIYNSDVQATQLTKANNISDTINDIISNLLRKVVDKDDNTNKISIFPDGNWTKRTTGDLGALLDNINTEELPEVIECERCDKRFRSKEDLKEHDVNKHKVEYDYELLYRKHEKLLDKFTILTRANTNRLEITEENNMMRKVLTKTEEAIHKTREANQVLEETVKIKDMEINAIEDAIKLVKEECEKRVKEAKSEVKQKNQMVRSLEEELGVWDKDVSQEPNEAESVIQNEWVSEEARRQNILIFKCKNCNFKTNDSVRMLGHMTKHTGYQCNKCTKYFKNQGDLNDHVQTEHRPDLYTCIKCQKHFQAKNGLKQHMNSHYPNNPPVGHPQWANNRNQAQGLDYCCNLCGNCFEELKELK